jgi:hypothetical protein
MSPAIQIKKSVSLFIAAARRDDVICGNGVHGKSNNQNKPKNHFLTKKDHKP